MKFMFETAIPRKVFPANNAAFRGNAAACGLFDKFVPQEKLGEEKAQNINAKGREYIWKTLSGWKSVLRPEYEKAVEMLDGSKYCANDVAAFALSLAGAAQDYDSGHNAGLFLSALINKGTDSDYYLPIRALEGCIHSLGRENCKNIRIDGDVGDSLGWKMKGGSIIVNGNAGDYAGGNMRDGRILVKGNVGDNFGSSASGGLLEALGNAGHYAGGSIHRETKIIIRGNAGLRLGGMMCSGEIIVGGNAEDEGGWAMRGGRITILGDAGRGLGEDAKDGAIIVLGDVESIRKTKARILVNGWCGFENDLYCGCGVPNYVKTEVVQGMLVLGRNPLIYLRNFPGWFERLAIRMGPAYRELVREADPKIIAAKLETGNLDD
ncbi:Molybdenum-containing formylmethanofuran dehydrogenase 1 subunit C [uncultured archaeon]|nr:Molybdenum-containing formylmethanofuran dehydrogenase 1 subunit C [uncultured archaeon]